MLQAWLATRAHLCSPFTPQVSTSFRAASLMPVRLAIANTRRRLNATRRPLALELRARSCMSTHDAYQGFSVRLRHACQVTSCVHISASAPAPDEVAASRPCDQAHAFRPRAGQAKPCVALQGCCLIQPLIVGLAQDMSAVTAPACRAVPCSCYCMYAWHLLLMAVTEAQCSPSRTYSVQPPSSSCQAHLLLVCRELALLCI